MEHVITLEQVCAILHISVGTGRNRLSRGEPMPPSFRTGRRRLFVESAVDEWICVQAGINVVDVMRESSASGIRRGRPRQNKEIGA